jgi:signal transduction histidine kinase
MNITRLGLYAMPAGLTAGALLASAAVKALWPDWHWQHEPFHSTVEAIGGVASIAMAMMLLQRQGDVSHQTHDTLAAGFLGMGVLEVFHASATTGDGFVLLRNVASLVGGIGFALIWVPSNTWSRRWGAAFFVSVIAAATAFGCWVIGFPEQIPPMIRHGEFTPSATAPQSLACLLFLAGALRFFLDYRRWGRGEDYVFTALALMFGMAEFVFMYSIPWGGRWWFWHLLRLMACLVVLWEISRSYLRMVMTLTGSLEQTRQAEETLRRNEQQLRLVLSERERFAQELHDGAIQSIFAIGLGLERCQRLITTDPKETFRQLGASLADLRLVIRDLRGYLAGSDPPLANGREFAEALTALVHRMDVSQQLRFHVEIHSEAADRVTGQQAAHMLSIAREAMSNSLRHSEGRTGTVSLHMQGEWVRLTIEDDGIGFSPETTYDRGHGLRNMDSRTRGLGGHFTVETHPGRGTRIIVDLPLEPQHAPA